MSVPWLSVLIPVYNGGATLEATLASVADQADGIEVILVDQGSTDESRSIAERYAGRMVLRIIDAPNNENWVQNTNLALEVAQADRAVLLHQDDLWRPGRAASLKAAFEVSPEAALWVQGADYIDADGRVVGSLAPAFGAARQVSKDEAMERLIVQNTIAIPAAAFPVAAARDLAGLDAALWYTADWQFWLGLAAQGDTHWSPERLVAFRLHGASLTVAGSKDVDDFEAQLAEPVARFSAGLPVRAVAMAEASNRVNVWLASVFHGARRPVWPVLKAVFTLGPMRWRRFLADTQILARVWPRVRVLYWRKGGSA